MVEIRLERREIVFRTLIVGIDADAARGFLDDVRADWTPEETRSVGVLRAEGDRLLFAPHRPADLDRLFGMDPWFAGVAFDGQAASRGNLLLMLRYADAVLFVPDEAEPKGGRVRRFLDEFSAAVEESGRDRRRLVVGLPGAEPASIGRELGFAVVELPSESSPSDRFEAIEEAIIASYRTWEKELDHEGMAGNFKIGDRIYERVERPSEGRRLKPTGPRPGEWGRSAKKGRGTPGPDDGQGSLLWSILAVLIAAAIAALFYSASL